nr:PREDICTED: odorant receptor 9a-like [Megachile rotundata]
MKNKDLAYAMTPLKILSWPIGTWPLQEYNAFSFARFGFTTSVLFLSLLVTNAEFVCTRGSDPDKDMYAVMLLVCNILALSKITYFRVHSAKLIFNFVSAVKDYNELDNEKKRAIMRQHARMSRLTFVGLMSSATVCSAFLTFLPVLKRNENSINMTFSELLKYPIPSEQVITSLELPEYLYLLIFTMEFMTLPLISAGNLGSDILFFGIVFHVCGQAEILKMEYNQVTDGSTEKFHALIKRHGYLLKLTEMLNDAVSSVLAIQLLSSCILICACDMQFLLIQQDGNIASVARTAITMIILMIQLFAYSYVGNYLKCQMAGVGYSLYSCTWYNFSTNVAKEIIFVILRAQKPAHLVAGKFTVVNLETFTSILKTSMSCLSVARVMMSR